MRIEIHANSDGLSAELAISDDEMILSSLH
jgi:hypothetical protein